MTFFTTEKNIAGVYALLGFHSHFEKKKKKLRFRERSRNYNQITVNTIGQKRTDGAKFENIRPKPIRRVWASSEKHEVLAPNSRTPPSASLQLAFVDV
jgi:hypothetical protein